MITPPSYSPFTPECYMPVNTRLNGARHVTRLDGPPPQDALDAAMSSTWKARCGIPQPAVQPLLGGLNNEVYLCRTTWGPICVKWYRSDGRRRHEREVKCLEALSPTSVMAPVPYSLASHEGVHGLAMEYLPPGDGPSLRRPDVEGVGRTVRHLHDSVPVAALSQVLDSRLTRHEMTAIVDRAGFFREAELDGAWRAVRDQVHQALDRPGRPVLGQTDGNFRNFIKRSGGFSVIDFEYGGRSDEAYELALLRAHPGAFLAKESRWTWFLAGYGTSAGDALVEQVDVLEVMVLGYWTAQPGSTVAVS
jgi:hypothetical protein